MRPNRREMADDVLEMGLHLISHSISFHNQPRRPLGLVPLPILSPARFTPPVSAHARLFPFWFSSSRPDLQIDACASPRRLHLIYVSLSQDLRIPPPLLRHCCVVTLAGGSCGPRCPAHSTHPTKLGSVILNAPDRQHEQ
jgi:hypothetical protein